MMQVMMQVTTMSEEKEGVEMKWTNTRNRDAKTNMIELYERKKRL